MSPTEGENKRAVTKLKTHKAPSLNEVPPDVFKSMNDKCLEHVLTYLNTFRDQKADFESWHRSQLIPVPMPGDLSDPSK